MMIVDILPSLSVDERKLVGSQAHNGAIILVQLPGTLSNVTFGKIPYKGEA